MKKTAACALLLLALTGCGASEDDTAKKNIKESVLKESSSVAGGAKLTEKQAECFADGMVDDVGVEDMQKYKLLDKDLKIIKDATPTDMPQGDADATADVIVSCVDMRALITAQINDSAKTDLTAEQSDCVDAAIDEDVIRDALSASFQGKQSEGMNDMQGELFKCVMGGETPTE